MSKHLIEQNSISTFVTRYKKWLIAAVGIQLFPKIIFAATILGIALVLFITNDSNWHSYKSYIESGYDRRVIDGNKDRGIAKSRIDYIDATPWEQYRMETEKIKAQVIKEKDEYLTQFPENERGGKRAEMRAEGVKLPIEERLEKRFKNGVNFYADYVNKKIKREAYASDEEYIYCIQMSNHFFKFARPFLNYSAK